MKAVGECTKCRSVLLCALATRAKWPNNEHTQAIHFCFTFLMGATNKRRTEASDQRVDIILGNVRCTHVWNLIAIAMRVSKHQTASGLQLFNKMDVCWQNGHTYSLTMYCTQWRASVGFIYMQHSRQTESVIEAIHGAIDVA